MSVWRTGVMWSLEWKWVSGRAVEFWMYWTFLRTWGWWTIKKSSDSRRCEKVIDESCCNRKDSDEWRRALFFFFLMNKVSCDVVDMVAEGKLWGVLVTTIAPVMIISDFLQLNWGNLSASLLFIQWGSLSKWSQFHWWWIWWQCISGCHRHKRASEEHDSG